MERIGRRDGVDAVPVSGGTALFATAEAAPSGLVAAGLASAAGEHLARLVGEKVPVLFAEQKHTRVSFVFGAHAPLAPGVHPVGVCDALLTTEPGVALCVRTADCLPIVVAGGGVIAAVHAGWRGLAADILGATVRRFAAEFGVEAGSLEVVIGVGIGPCHYQVGREVIEALSAPPVAGEGWQGDGRVDLARWAAGRLRATGVGRERILTLPGCTFCTPGYHSYRRDGARAGRQWNAVILTPAAPPQSAS